MPWIEDAGTGEEAAFSQAEYAQAFQVWCDAPDLGARFPEPGETIWSGGRYVPVGDLVDSLRNGPTAESAWMTQDLRDTIDYHGAPLQDVDCDDGVRRVYIQFEARLRPSGWEHQFIHDLDAHFEHNPGVYPDMSTPAGAGLRQLERTGLNVSNWSRMPDLSAAFARHGIATVMRDGQLRVDRNGYRPGAAPLVDRRYLGSGVGQSSSSSSRSTTRSYENATQGRPAGNRRHSRR